MVLKKDRPGVSAYHGLIITGLGIGNKAGKRTAGAVLPIKVSLEGGSQRSSWAGRTSFEPVSPLRKTPRLG